MKIDIEQVKELMRALRRYGLSELEIRQGEERITLRREGVGGAARRADLAPSEGAFPLETGGRSPATGLSMAPPPMPSGVGVVPPPTEAAEDPSLETITAPLVGTFYRASGPGAKAFADVGTVVRPGQVVCIVEAMKLMNEIESEVDGTITEVLVKDGKPVQFGQALFRVRRG